MADVTFHTGIGDKLDYACRLLRKAYRQGARVAVSGEPRLLQQLDQALWTFEAQEFVPHLRLAPGKAVPAAQRRTPIWLLEPGAQVPDAQVLVNLGPQRCAEDAAYPRIVELVSAAPEDARAGRQRWKAYEAEGWPIRHHPVGARA